LKRICDLSEDVKVIDKEIDKLNREKEQVSRKIVELNKNGKKR